MEWNEALAEAQKLFGRTADITDGVQMAATLERAKGVGFREGGDLCIQGKGLTWEEALAHAEMRRPKWQGRARDADQKAGSTPSPMPKVPQSDEHPRGDGRILDPTILDGPSETEEEAIIRRIREKMKVWKPYRKKNLGSEDASR